MPHPRAFESPDTLTFRSEHTSEVKNLNHLQAIYSDINDQSKELSPSSFQLGTICEVQVPRPFEQFCLFHVQIMDGKEMIPDIIWKNPQTGTYSRVPIKLWRYIWRQTFEEIAPNNQKTSNNGEIVAHVPQDVYLSRMRMAELKELRAQDIENSSLVQTSVFVPIILWFYSWSREKDKRP